MANTNTYSVWLSTASFSPTQESGYMRGDFVFMLLINSAPQTQLELTVEAQTTSPTALIGQAQQELQAALTGWAASLGQ
ncbi:hypothetical protein JYJ95_09400 [Corallococcus exiguus]|uniref:hypothetical protein n=1 Tax=Corallococcus exiguus TaxID=83462 RepID=UPI00155FB82B|nr:hypothetical protein [Corallococcus exiguus]MBN8466730.1 hypothetical protein [Corallococcus exiguus]NRD43914.1 hypothetical protein [Corallococcus exiguus]